jgi:HSP20 family protein
MASWPSVLIAQELGDLADDVRRLFQELERFGGQSSSVLAGQCTPPLDVLETDEAVEIVVDVPGVAPHAIRVLLKGDVVVVAGEKVPAGPHAAGDYHLVERGSGRFARAIRVSAAVDGSRAVASLVRGELRVILPKIHDRRGQARPLPITTEPQAHEC